MIVLGLDISTAITGYCLIDTDAALGHRLVKADGIIISKEKGLYSKAIVIRNELQRLHCNHTIDYIIIEENLQAFRRGLSSAKTLSTLARFNGVVSFLAEDIFQVPVIRTNVNSARSQLGLKIDRKSDVSVKQQVLIWVQDQPDFLGFVWPTKTLKSGPRKGKTIDAPQCFDIADAAVMSLTAIAS